ncbi:hypothetical protein DNTS_026925, partial [Danionella cerebrum]
MNFLPLFHRAPTVDYDSAGKLTVQENSNSLSELIIRNLQREYEQLRRQQQGQPRAGVRGGLTDEADLLAEAKLLRENKGHLEARMQILEEHNKQLESQLHRLRQLLHQVNLEIFITVCSDELESGQVMEEHRVPELNGTSSSSVHQDTAGLPEISDDFLLQCANSSSDLAQVLEQINHSFPACS